MTSADQIENSYTAVDDVRRIIAFPRNMEDEEVADFIREGAGEINTIFTMLGVSIPVTQPPQLLDMLRSAVANKAASMVALRSPQGASAEIARAQSEMYNNEFIRIRDWLAGLTSDMLIKLGVLGVVSTPTTVVLNAGLVLAHHHWPDPDPWYGTLDKYPIIRIP